MAHVRTQIRAAVVTALTGLTTTGTNVFRSRRHELTSDEVPGLRIYTDDEPEVEPLTIENPTLQQRSVVLLVEGVAVANDDLDDTLDDIAEEVEVAMAADVTLGGLVVSLHLESTEIEESVEGEQPVGVVRLIYAVVYMVNSNAPGTAIV